MDKKVVKKDTKYELAKRTALDNTFIPVIHNLLTKGYTLADVGMLIGYSGKDSEGWLRRLSADNTDLDLAIQEGIEAANIELIKTAFNECMGYWVEEEDITAQKEKITPKGKNTYYKWTEKWKKTKKRFIPPNTALLWKLLMSRMPQHFNESKRIEIDKKSIELKGEIESEIKSFAGQLMDALSDDIEIRRVDSREIEDERSDDKEMSSL